MDKQFEDAMRENNIPNPIVLSRPILINGSNVTELTWNADEITIDLFCEAEKQMQKNQVATTYLEGDYILHFYLGCALIIADNQPISFEDLKQIKGLDMMQVVKVGRFFISQSMVSEESSSEGSPGNTPGNTRPPSPKSDDGPSETSSSSTPKPAKTPSDETKS